MNQRMFVTVAALFSAVSLSSHAATEKSNSEAGQWKLIVEKSTFLPLPKSQKLSIVPDGDAVETTIEGVNAAGAPFKNEYTARYDGKDNPVSGQQGGIDMISLKRVNGNVVRTTSKNKGQIINVGMREISKDGKGMTTKIQTRNTWVYALSKGPSAMTKDPTMGTWELNVEKSQFVGPPPKSGTNIREPDGKGVKIQSENVNVAGAVTKSEYTANYDGKDYLVPVVAAGAADTVTLKRISARAWKATFKKGGQVRSINTNTVSPDGKTLTNDFVFYSVAVYEKE